MSNSIDNITDFLKKTNIFYNTNVPLKKKTWIKTGGIAKYWIEPHNILELKKIVLFLSENNYSFDVVGYTSNIYFLDNYNPTIVIATFKLNVYEDDGKCIECECGTPVAKISHYAICKGYKGYSGLVNLPGTIAAAAYNNSSCFGCEVSSLIDCIEIFNTKSLKIDVLKPEEMSYSFRSSALKRKEIFGIILRIRLKTSKGDIQIEKLKAAIATKKRKDSQEPPAYTLGSIYAGLVVKNNVKYMIANRCAQVLNILGFSKRSILKKLLLRLYAYADLDPFVSNYNINTFKWLPHRKDLYQKFCRYQEFINKAYLKPKLEIEIRGNDLKSKQNDR